MGKISKTQRRLKHKAGISAQQTSKRTGKIGKPQKSKKHKKIKSVDVYNEGGDHAKRHDQTANRAPSNDEQEIPRKVQSFMDSKDELKKGKRKKRKRKSNDFHLERGMLLPLKPVPKFKKKKGESEKGFMRRIEAETQRVILKSKLSDKYKVDFEEIDKGKEIVKQNQKAKKNTERLKHKKMYKSSKKSEMQEDKKGDFSHLKDKVVFGEVAMAPPSITAKPKKAKDLDTAVRPGRKSLLLKEIISGNSLQNSGTSSTTRRPLGQTTKRKHLSLSKQQIMDTEREKAINLYRSLKNAKLKMS